MPVGLPQLVNYSTLELFLEAINSGLFFGFVEATVKAPPLTSHAGYIGLLPIKFQGRIICPGGIFTGFFFSEELLFALDNGYILLSVNKTYSFQRGVNTFKELIATLNQMKIDAQMNNKPTIRNIAKLLMNSMYGRFRMKTINQLVEIVNKEGLESLMKNYQILDEKVFTQRSR